MEQPAVVASQVLDRRAQNARIEDSPATSSVSVSVDDRANLSFFSSSQRFCVYEVGVLVATCSRLPPRFCAYGRPCSSLLVKAGRRMKLISISSPAARQQPPFADTPLNWI
jgi:hypothetical protein